MSLTISNLILAWQLGGLVIQVGGGNSHSEIAMFISF